MGLEEWMNHRAEAQLIDYNTATWGNRDSGLTTCHMKSRKEVTSFLHSTASLLEDSVLFCAPQMYLLLAARLQQKN